MRRAQDRSAKRDVQKFRSAKRAAREALDENVPAKRADFFKWKIVKFLEIDNLGRLLKSNIITHSISINPRWNNPKSN